MKHSKQASPFCSGYSQLIIIFSGTQDPITKINGLMGKTGMRQAGKNNKMPTQQVRIYWEISRAAMFSIHLFSLNNAYRQNDPHFLILEYLVI